MRPAEPPALRPRPAVLSDSVTSNRWPFVSLACGVAPILLLLLYHPVIGDILQRLFPDANVGAYTDFLAVPLLLTAGAVGSGIAAVRRSYRLPRQRARFGLAVTALSLGVLDIGLFVVGWLGTYAVMHS